eukprot:2492833-Rhodomonas_salina.3
MMTIDTSSLIQRRPSIATARADDVRTEMLELFQNVDEDGNGTVDLQELRTIIRKKLQMQLNDPSHDVEIIFGETLLPASHLCLFVVKYSGFQKILTCA